MLFRVFITGIFTGTIAAVFAITNGAGPVLALISYAIFGALAVLGMGILSMAAPSHAAGSQTRRLPYWKDRLDRMVIQTTSAATKPAVCVFSSVRQGQHRIH